MIRLEMKVLASELVGDILFDQEQELLDLNRRIRFPARWRQSSKHHIFP